MDYDYEKVKKHLAYFEGKIWFQQNYTIYEPDWSKQEKPNVKCQEYWEPSRIVDYLQQHHRNEWHGYKHAYAADYITTVVTEPDANGKNRCRKNLVTNARELVLDVDFKDIDSQYDRTSPKDRDECTAGAMKFIATVLPEPTFTVFSGGGLQIHFLFSEDVSRERYEREYRRLTDYLNDEWGKRNPSSKRLCDSTSNANHIFRLAGTVNFKLKDHPVLVEFIQESGKRYSLSDIMKNVKDLFDKVENTSCTTLKDKQRAKKIISHCVSHCGHDRSALAYGIISRLHLDYPTASEETLFQLLKQDQNFMTEAYGHYEKHGMSEADHLLRRDIRKKISERIEDIQPPIPSMPLPDCETDISIFDNARKQFPFTLSGVQKENADELLKGFTYSEGRGESVIWDVPCGVGKSTSAKIFIASTLKQQVIWYVSPTIDTTRQAVRDFQGMGVDAIPFHGWKTGICEHCKDWQDCHNQCGKYPDCTRCGGNWKYGGASFPSTSFVLCMTTQGYKTNSNGLPAPHLCMIDEAVGCTQTLTIVDDGALSAYDSKTTEIREWMGKMSLRLMSGDTVRLENVRFPSHLCKQAYQDIKSGNQYAAVAEKYLECFGFFRHSSFVWGQKEGNKMTFMTGSVERQTEAMTWILDGSAKFSDVKWLGFTSYNFGQTTYPNLTVHCLDSLPTKSALAHKGKLHDDLMKSIENIPIGKTIGVFTDIGKDGDKLEQDILEALKMRQPCEVICRKRGQHIGTNDMRDCNVLILAMGLFTDITDYALGGSIITGKSILNGQIYSQAKNGKKPNMGKFGFASHAMNQRLCRQIGNEAYQAIMRGIVRADSSAECTVILPMNHPTIIAELKTMLPEATIFISDIERLYHSGYSAQEIALMTNGKKKDIENFIARRIKGDQTNGNQ